MSGSAPETNEFLIFTPVQLKNSLANSARYLLEYILLPHAPRIILALY